MKEVQPNFERNKKSTLNPKKSNFSKEHFLNTLPRYIVMHNPFERTSLDTSSLGLFKGGTIVYDFHAIVNSVEAGLSLVFTQVREENHSVIFK